MKGERESGGFNFMNKKIIKSIYFKKKRELI